MAENLVNSRPTLASKLASTAATMVLLELLELASRPSTLGKGGSKSGDANLKELLRVTSYAILEVGGFVNASTYSS